MIQWNLSKSNLLGTKFCLRNRQVCTLHRLNYWGYGLDRFHCNKYLLYARLETGRIMWLGVAGVHTGFRTITLVLYIGSLPNLATWFPCGRGRTLFILGSLPLYRFIIYIDGHILWCTHFLFFYRINKNKINTVYIRELFNYLFIIIIIVVVFRLHSSTDQYST
jgi:hypothetical protein